jgi:glycosyltransferase involved in cell wall biosynthesis
MEYEKVRVFIGLKEVAGYYTNLKKGFDKLSIEATFLNLKGHKFQYGTQNSDNLINFLNRFSQRLYPIVQRNIVFKIAWLIVQKFLGFFLFFWALPRFNVFIFGASTSFFFHLEFPLLKIFKKKIICVFHGSDSRPPYLDGFVITNNSKSTIFLWRWLTKMRKVSMKLIDRYADHIIDIHPQAHFHARPFVSFLTIGLPYDIVDIAVQSTEKKEKNNICILHAPSQPGPKGTREIGHAIKRLQEKGYKIDFIEISGLPNSEVIKKIRQCDFVVDQLYSDTPMPGFPAEAAFLGKPAVVGGYYSVNIHKDLPADKIPPSLFCHPDDIEKSIEKMINDTEFRLDLGRRAKEFVHANWTPEQVANRYLMLMTDRYPKDWLNNPADITYLHGCGLSEYRAKQLIQTFINKGGVESICLSDKPILERKLVDFASAIDTK